MKCGEEPETAFLHKNIAGEYTPRRSVWNGGTYGIFDNMKETLTSAGRDVSQKAKEVSNIAKLKMDIKSKQDALDKQYIELGKHYYEMNKEGEVDNAALPMSAL